jgi:hypothetical protein
MGHFQMGDDSKIEDNENDGNQTAKNLLNKTMSFTSSPLKR